MIDPYELLREVLASGRSFDDPRVRYVEVQLSRQLRSEYRTSPRNQGGCRASNQ